jgi:hypothetical protein
MSRTRATALELLIVLSTACAASSADREIVAGGLDAGALALRPAKRWSRCAGPAGGRGWDGRPCC